MNDGEGVEWLRPKEAAARIGLPKPDLVYVWIHRHKIRTHTIHRRVYVNMPDIYDAEQKTRGAYPTQRSGPPGDDTPDDPDAALQPPLSNWSTT